MNLELVERVAEAVLYEGYMLYPYTASSVKNQKRFHFGVLSPPGMETSEMQTECLVLTERGCEIGVLVRFLQMGDAGEAVERRIDTAIGRHEFRFEQVCGEVDAVLSPVEGALHRLTVKIRNCSEGGGEMLSVHTILTARGGEFVSLTDPGAYADAAAACQNVGTWPVLAGVEGERDTMLSSPIILYDYPQLAPESPGNLFDATEIDEILTLRILTLSDDEKAEIRAGGARAKEVLERSESLAPEQLRKLHGAVRGLRQVDR
jgi:hypothetical protein